MSHASIDDIAGEAARSTLGGESFLRLETAATTDSDGHDALLVTLVINDLRRSPVSGDTVAETILRLKQDLQAAGESRSIVVQFATEDELASDAES